MPLVLVPQLLSPIPGGVPLITTLTNLGLTTNLKMAMDFGDADCYTSGQTCNDTSANGLDLYRGATSGSEASDPTFNGIAGGLSDGEYFLFDGGDWFTLTVSNPAEINNIHKNSALYTIFGWIYVPSTISTTNTVCGTADALSESGFYAYITSANAINLVVFNGSGSSRALNDVSFSSGPSTDAWNFVCLSVDEAAGPGGSHFRVGSSTETFDATYTSPSTSAASGTFEVAARDGGTLPLENNSRMGQFGLYEGVSLTTTQTGQIYDETKGRFGL